MGSEKSLAKNKPVQSTGEKNFTAVVTINDEIVNPNNIISFYIRETVFEFLPTLSMTIIDNGQFDVDTPLFCGQEIKVTIRKSGETKKTVSDVPFSIVSFEKKSIDSKSGGLNVIDMKAIYNNVSLFSGLKSVAFGKVNFSDTVKEIGKRCGFSSDKIFVTDSHDRMNWCCLNMTFMDYITNTVKHSWISEKDCPVCFVDFEGRLNYKGIYENIVSQNRISMVFDLTGTVAPVSVDSGMIGTGESHSDIVVPYYNYEFKDFSGFMNAMEGGYTSTMTWFSNDTGKLEKETFSNIPKTTLSLYSNINKNQNGDVTKTYTFASDLYSIHDNYFRSTVKNTMILNRIFSECLVVYGASVSTFQNFGLLSKVNVDIQGTGKRAMKPLNEGGNYVIGGIILALNRDAMNEVYLCFRDGYNESETKGSMDDLIRN